MSRIYDNWERLVAAVIKREQLWQLFHDQSRTPSTCSEASDFSSSPFSQKFDDAFCPTPSRLVLVSDFSPSIDVEDLSLASSKLLEGQGTFGSVCTAVMDNGVKIVVKRLSHVNVLDIEFRRNMEIVGNVRHENVVPLRAYYSSKDERLMLYDYYSKGSVYALLHGQLDENRAQVYWETRLRIAVGAARGIAEIHAQNGGELVHGNIKASNVFINSQQYGCISDLGLANVIETTFLPTSWCYAPEVNGTQNISQPSDVYGFGILILELLTRKSPVYLYGGPEAVDLVKLVTSVKNKRWAAKVFDLDLLNQPTLEEPMVKMLQIGLSCVAKSPKRRPKMSEVVKMLEEIGGTSTGTPASVQPKLVFVEDDNPTFDLEDMLRSSAEVLKKGTFGTSYKAILGNGKTIVVKMLKGVNFTLDEFQQHMEVIRRMRHENVATLKAYYFSEDRKLLVYDYCYRCSLSALLHGVVQLTCTCDHEQPKPYAKTHPSYV